MRKQSFYIIAFLLYIVPSSSCTKEFLAKKPNQDLVVPATLADFRALLDRPTDLTNVSPGLQEIAADDFYRDSSTLLSMTAVERGSYLWADNPYQGAVIFDWDNPYSQIFYCNVVLDGLAALKPDSSAHTEYNDIKGSALFFRSVAFYMLAAEFAAPYDSATASTLPGIPLHLSSDVNQIETRGTLQQTFTQIVNDLQAARQLLPVHGAYSSRPDQISTSGMLTRIFLVMHRYQMAEEAASAYLTLRSDLLDYNTLSSTSSRPFPLSLPNGNAEVSLYLALRSYSFIVSSSTYADTSLYRLYDPNDLRKKLYFTDRGNGHYTFKGSYTGSSAAFNGIATDEIYLSRAEARVRDGDLTGGLSDLNTLLRTRWVTGAYQPFTAPDQDSALRLILKERRKELIGRGTRWSDLRRLNEDPAYATTLTRNLGGQVYTLTPNSDKYIFPIPDNEIRASGVAQNPR